MSILSKVDYASLWGDKDDTTNAILARVRRPLRRVALVGHSWTVQPWAGPTSDSPRGIAYWAGLFSGQRLQFDYSRGFGRSGDTSGPFGSNPGFQSRLPDALASGADTIIFSDPTNDFAAGVPSDTTIANMAALFQQARLAGALVATWAVTPRSAPSALSAAGLLAQAKYQNWLRGYAPANGIVLIDASATLSAPTTGGFEFAAGMAVADNLHAAIPGGRALGLAAARALDHYLEPFDALAYSNADAYNAASNPGGNLFTNPAFVGTGGTQTAGGSTMSGQMPDGWQLSAINGAGLTIASSVITRGSRRLVDVTVSGTATAGNPAIWVRQTPAFAGQVAEGDRLYAQAGFELDQDSAGVTGLGIQQWTTGAVNTSMRTGDSVGSNVNGFFSAEAINGPLPLRTMPNPTPANPASMYAQFGVAGLNGVAISARFRVASPELRRA